RSSPFALRRRGAAAVVPEGRLSEPLKGSYFPEKVGSEFPELTRVSRRIKRLRGMRQPQYRLRVGEMRVFYDVTETEVQVLAIVSKDEVRAWLEQEGQPEA
ncbi:MAG: type II toxin-antitoxin system RelE family toxin, partial [Candidatus Eiseniibacteriota bacterium]